MGDTRKVVAPPSRATSPSVASTKARAAQTISESEVHDFFKDVYNTDCTQGHAFVRICRTRDGADCVTMPRRVNIMRCKTSTKALPEFTVSLGHKDVASDFVCTPLENGALRCQTPSFGFSLVKKAGKVHLTHGHFVEYLDKMSPRTVSLYQYLFDTKNPRFDSNWIPASW